MIDAYGPESRRSTGELCECAEHRTESVAFNVTLCAKKTAATSGESRILYLNGTPTPAGTDPAPLPDCNDLRGGRMLLGFDAKVWFVMPGFPVAARKTR